MKETDFPWFSDEENEQLLSYIWDESGIRFNFLRHITGLPPWRYFDLFECTTDEQRRAVAVCERFILDLMRNGQSKAVLESVWLIGLPGTGKTMLANIMVALASLSGMYRPLIATPKQIVRQLHASTAKSARAAEAQVLEYYSAPELLVLDDLGADSLTASEMELLGEIVSERWNMENPTCLTSNLDADNLRRVLGPRTFDRMRHGAHILPLTGESYRKPAHAPTGDEGRVVPIGAPRARRSSK